MFHFCSCCTFVSHLDWWKESNAYTFTSKDASLLLWTPLFMWSPFTHESGGCRTLMQPTSCSELILVAGMIAVIYGLVLSHLSSTWLRTDNCLLLMMTILLGFKAQVTKEININGILHSAIFCKRKPMMLSPTCKQKLYNNQQQCVISGRNFPLTFRFKRRET